MAGPGTDTLVDVIDAEFISIDPAAAREFPERERAKAIYRPIFAPPVEGMEMLTGASDAPVAVRASGGPLFWCGGVLTALAAFWIAGGHSLISRPNELAASDNSGLRIASVISRVDRNGEKPILMVDGKAVNEGVSAVPMPPLHIQIVSTAGVSTLYKLGTAGQRLASGDFFDFSSRLELPKDGVKTVFVTFAQ